MLLLCFISQKHVQIGRKTTFKEEIFMYIHERKGGKLLKYGCTINLHHKEKFCNVRFSRNRRNV